MRTNGKGNVQGSEWKKCMREILKEMGLMGEDLERDMGLVVWLDGHGGYVVLKDNHGCVTLACMSGKWVVVMLMFIGRQGLYYSITWGVACFCMALNFDIWGLRSAWKPFGAPLYDFGICLCILIKCRQPTPYATRRSTFWEVPTSEYPAPIPDWAMVLALSFSVFESSMDSTDGEMTYECVAVSEDGIRRMCFPSFFRFDSNRRGSTTTRCSKCICGTTSKWHEGQLFPFGCN